VARDAHQAIAHPQFMEVCEMNRSHGKILERFAKRLEGCECHRELLTSRMSWKSKKRKLKQESGHANCYMRSRQGAWFQGRGLSLLFAEIDSCTSDLLQELLSSMAPGERALLVRLQLELADRLKEELLDKLGFHRELPYCIIGIYYGEVIGGCVQRAKEILRKALDEFDTTVASGRGAKLHRVALY